MKFHLKQNLVVIISTILVSISVSCAQEKKENPVPQRTSKDEFESMINTTFPFIEGLLKKHGEFFPMATALDKNDKIVQIGTYDGSEKPTSQNVIDDLKSGLRGGVKKGDYKAIAIFYDVRIVSPTTKEKTDAVAVFVENEREATAFTIIYTYSLTKDRVLTFGETWKNSTEKEIFIQSEGEK